MSTSAFLFRLFFFGLLASPLLARADTFGTGENAFTIDFVTIGDPGNAADTTGDPNPAGAVPYTYRIGKYEIPEHAIRRANSATENSSNPLNITLDERGSDKPATSVSWFEAARFVNYLNEDKGVSPAYKFDSNGEFQLWELGDLGYDPTNPFRNSLARYFLPSADEWYKAAFYDPVTDAWFDYPNGMDIPPVAVASGTDANTAVYNQAGPADVLFAGGASPFGTVGQAGNVSEWEESEGDLLNDMSSERRGVRGRDWSMGLPELVAISLSSASRGKSLPFNEPVNVGFRIASVPEPPSVAAAVLLVSFIVILAVGRASDATLQQRRE